jgi:ribosomal protein S18 acetylase RimI-like enzyme
LTGFHAFAAARLQGSGLSLRAASTADLQRLAEIYATTRSDELASVPWSDAQKKTFTDSQSRQQEAHYALHYPNAERLVVERGETVIGRIYVDTTAKEVRLMEVTLLPAFRNQGIGTSLTGAFVDYADALGLPSSLHVEPFNPAKRMYERLGFATLEMRGLYAFMQRPARPS